MNGRRADASTSTDDAKGRPLCLFYFTHPFGVLSPEPPTVTVAPPNIARTFINMEPVPFWTSSSPGYDTTSTGPSYDIGNATVHRKPVNLVRNYEIRRDSVTSSLFSSDIWFSSSASSRRVDCERRVVPYNRTLPPLQVPAPRHLDFDSSDDIWPKKCSVPGKFSLPPIELPVSSVSEDFFDDKVSVCDSEIFKRHRRVFGVRKHRRSRVSSVKRMITCLIQRNIRGRVRHTSPALREALRVLREAWVEPRALRDRWKTVSDDSCETCESTSIRANMWSGEVPARPSASPGLLRRRYSVPETIMRKYRLAQQRSEGDTDEAGRWSATGASSGTRASCAWCGARAGGVRREREHMRKSALLRLWGRAGASPARACPCVPCAPCGTRSLDASHSELNTSPRRLRLDTSRDRHSDSSGSPARAASSCTDPIPDVSIAKDISPRHVNKAEAKVVRTPVESPTLYVDLTDRSLTDSSDAFTTSMPTMKDVGYRTLDPCGQISTSDYIDGRVSERTASAENTESNVVPYNRPLSLQPPYDILEVVVSETLDVRPVPTNNVSREKATPQTGKTQIVNRKKSPNIDLDEYVSNILVESLNSLTDQLESMNATIGHDRKLSIVEKEIKVKLQNTGVNTIVHLSPTSNNQIIFGNEELYESDNRRDDCNNPREIYSGNMLESAISLETNNNLTSAESLRTDDMTQKNCQPKSESFLNVPSETVNKAVLQQIQKLFQEELHSMEPQINSPDGPMPSISHIEISNVDVFIDNNSGPFSNTDAIEVQTQRNSSEYEVLGGVGASNYYQEDEDNAIIPRFSAFPHTESMEVNTSSSEDAEILGSDCTSLVDSLDDPNSPRSILLRRSFSNNKRTELVRSAIDVLELLPENAGKNDHVSPKEKGESFFIRIKDDDCDCEKENIIVADHMPETIKQRLFKRHRKREMRMECARRSKVKQLKKDLKNENYKEVYKSKKEMERECMVIINALIDDVIAKIAQDEYKCMRISQRSNKLVATKSDENIKKLWKKDIENNNRNTRKLVKNVGSHSCSDNLDKDQRKSERLFKGKLTLQTRSPSSPEDSPPKRVYQKSEIRDGNKCIEILEILEYVNSSQSSDTTNSDENHNLSSKNKKSRIPIPVNEKVQRPLKGNTQRSQNTNGSRRAPPILSRERNGKSSHLLANMLLDVLEDEDLTVAHDVSVRRASVPSDTRSRSNSLRFKNVFDIIPEERSSLSIESTGDDSAYNRRASAPSLSEGLHSTDQEDKRIRPPESQYRTTKELRVPDTRNAGTSPISDPYRANAQVSVGAMTSPIRKSTGTSPIRTASAETRERGHYNPPASNQQSQQKVSKRMPTQRQEEEGTTRRGSISSQPEPTRRLRGGYSESDSSKPSFFRLKRGKKQDDHILASNVTSERRSSEEVSSFGDRERRKDRSRVKDVVGRRKADIKVEAQKKERFTQKAAFGRSEEDGADEMWSSSESSGSLLCSLAPAWLTARRRRRRAAPPDEWAVTVAGSCPAALPNDVEMRLRFPDPCRRTPAPAPPPQPKPPPSTCARAVECSAQCTQSGHARRVLDDAGRVTLTVKKEASDSSMVASKSVKKSSDLLPDLHTYRASRSKTRSSVKTGGGNPENISSDDALDRVAAILGSTCDGYNTLSGGDVVVEEVEEPLFISCVGNKVLLLNDPNSDPSPPNSSSPVSSPPVPSPPVPSPPATPQPVPSPKNLTRKVYYTSGTKEGKMLSVKKRNNAIADYFDAKRKQEAQIFTLKKRKLELEILELEKKFNKRS